jgi:hypothetical protein
VGDELSVPETSTDFASSFREEVSMDDRQALEKTLRLFRSIAEQHAPGESKQHLERFCDELESQLNSRDAKRK